ILVGDQGTPVRTHALRGFGGLVAVEQDRGAEQATLGDGERHRRGAVIRGELPYAVSGVPAFRRIDDAIRSACAAGAVDRDLAALRGKPDVFHRLERRDLRVDRARRVLPEDDVHRVALIRISGVLFSERADAGLPYRAVAHSPRDAVGRGDVR